MKKTPMYETIRALTSSVSLTSRSLLNFTQFHQETIFSCTLTSGQFVLPSGQRLPLVWKKPPECRSAVPPDRATECIRMGLCIMLSCRYQVSVALSCQTSLNASCGHLRGNKIAALSFSRRLTFSDRCVFLCLSLNYYWLKEKEGI